ncbi:maestro heat-like repeat family member 5 isoform X2 [Columba livia]|uniref:maestro heat-like repeat family member 5 isoform X2 n=1 Tax=Columba livia TaxID=8932 RepID=UPI0031BB62F8
MTWRPPFTPRVVWLNDDSEDEDEEEKEVEAAPASQHEEVQEHQLLQADPSWELPEEEQKQEDTHVLHNPRAKLFWETVHPKDCEGSTVELAEAMTEGQSYDAEAGAALLDMLVESEVSTLKQVPRIVRCIHRWFMTNTDESVEHSLDNTLVELTDAHPHDVVVALLRCAPSCDRAAAAMWRMMVTTSMTTKKVFRELLCVLEDWPLHSTSTCDGDQQDVLALAATRALWEILQMPRCPRGLKVYFPRLLLALLFQVVYSTEQMPDEVDTFWRECQEEGGLPTSPSRFIVLTVKALLCRLGYRLVAFEVERKRGWDTLLHAETHHCAMGLLAREIRVVSRHLNASVASYLVELLSRNEPRCELPAMAFLVEILASPGPNVRAESFLQLVPRYLQSNCSMTRSLLLKGLNVICDTPWMVPKMRFLVQRLTDLLQDADMDMVRMTLSVLRKVVRDPSVPISTPIALQLAERLQPLFDNESWYVRQLSVSIFKKVIERVANDGKKLLKTLVHQSLLPLIFHVFDENKAVAATCRDTLLQATAFLKKEKLRQVVLRDQQTEAIGECLVRMAVKPQPQPGQAPRAQCVGLAAVPLPTAAAHRRQPAAHTRSRTSGVRPHGLFSKLLSLPEPRAADGAPAQLRVGDRMALQLLGEQPALLLPPDPAPAGCWLGVVGVLAGEASPGHRDHPARGRVCTSPCLHPLSLSPAGRVPQQSSRVPGSVIDVRAEPTGLHTRGSHRFPWGPWAAHEGSAGEVPARLRRRSTRNKGQQPLRPTPGTSHSAPAQSCSGKWLLQIQAAGTAEPTPPGVEEAAAFSLGQWLAVLLGLRAGLIPAPPCALP